MNIKLILSGITAAVLICGTTVCHARKWDKNDVADATVESGYYDTESIKVKGGIVSWTEKYILTSKGASEVNGELSKFAVCKQNIEKNGNVTHLQLDYQLEKKSLKFRGMDKRYYNKDNKLICSDKDAGGTFKSDWNKVLRGTPMQRAQYDLVTKYKIKIQ